MANNVNETKARTIVLDSLKSTMINAGGSIHLNSQEIVVNGSIKRTYSSSLEFGNTKSLAASTSQIPITENQILNGLIVLHNGDIDKNYGANEQLAVTSATPGTITLPLVSDLRNISINQSVDFSIINNREITFVIGDNSTNKYIVIGHPKIYEGTSARFKLHRNANADYTVYRLS